MPTIYEFEALLAAVNTAWTSDYQGTGVSGHVLTDKTDGSKILFFPACGCAEDGNVVDVGTVCRYWTSSFLGKKGVNLTKGACFSFNTTNGGIGVVTVRCRGFQLRGIIG